LTFPQRSGGERTRTADFHVANVGRRTPERGCLRIFPARGILLGDRDRPRVPLVGRRLWCRCGAGATQVRLGIRGRGRNRPHQAHWSFTSERRSTKPTRAARRIHRGALDGDAAGQSSRSSLSVRAIPVRSAFQILARRVKQDRRLHACRPGRRRVQNNSSAFARRDAPCRAWVPLTESPSCPPSWCCSALRRRPRGVPIRGSWASGPSSA